MIIRKCYNCDKPLEKIGNMFFRTGDFSRASAIVLDTMKKTAGGPNEFTLYKCSSCGKIEFYAPESIE